MIQLHGFHTILMNLYSHCFESMMTPHWNYFSAKFTLNLLASCSSLHVEVHSLYQMNVMKYLMNHLHKKIIIIRSLTAKHLNLSKEFYLFLSSDFLVLLKTRWFFWDLKMKIGLDCFHLLAWQMLLNQQVDQVFQVHEGE